MAAFKGTVIGNRGEASRLGSERSGITASLNSYKVTCIVALFYDKKKDKQMIKVQIRDYHDGSVLDTYEYEVNN
jgi:hypothetical protein